jgi:hypothetical protein
MRMTGVRGEVRVGGRVAASLARWSFDGTPEHWEVEATPSMVDEFWLDSGGPFDLHLHIGSSIRTYRNVQVSGRSTLYISEGVPES